MRILKLSNLQSLIIDAIGAGCVSGRDLRERLKAAGAKKSGPSFYQAMSRLEDSKFVHGEYRQKIVDGHIFKERFYKVTAPGHEALAETVRLYKDLPRLGGAYA